MRTVRCVRKDKSADLASLFACSPPVPLLLTQSFPHKEVREQHISRETAAPVERGIQAHYLLTLKVGDMLYHWRSRANNPRVLAARLMFEMDD